MRSTPHIANVFIIVCSPPPLFLLLPLPLLFLPPSPPPPPPPPPPFSSSSSLFFKGFWMDIGQPKDFITGTGMYLNHLKATDPQRLTTGDNFVGPVLVVSAV